MRGVRLWPQRPPSRAVPVLTVVLAAAVAALATAIPVTTVAQPPAKKGGTAVFGSIQEPDRLNPILTSALPTGQVNDLIYDKLIVLTGEGKFVPELAVEVPTIENRGVSSDGLTYTFRLRRGVKFHDGVELTCKDVKFTWDTASDEKTKALYRQEFIATSSGGVECPDNYTVVFHHKQPVVNMLEIVATYGILPEHRLRGQEMFTARFNNQPIGTGPFRFKQWIKGDHLIFVKNPDYFKGEPNLDAIVYKYVPDANALLAQTQKGELDVRLRVPGSQVEAARRIKGYDLVAVPVHSIYSIFPNWDAPGMKDKRVRLALSYALDREGIAKTVLQGTVVPVDALLPGRSWVSSAPTQIRFDPDLARKLLDEAGWSPGVGGIRTKDGQQLKFTITTLPESERIRTLEVIIHQWKAIGVSASLEQVDTPTWGNRAFAQQFELLYGFASFGYEIDLRSRLGCDPKIGTANYGRWCVPGIDRLLQEQVVTLDRERRRAMLQEYRKIFMEEMPLIALFSRSEISSVSTKFHNYQPHPYISKGVSEFWNAEEWWKE